MFQGCPKYLRDTPGVVLISDTAIYCFLCTVFFVKLKLGLGNMEQTFSRRLLVNDEFKNTPAANQVEVHFRRFADW